MFRERRFSEFATSFTCSVTTVPVVVVRMIRGIGRRCGGGPEEDVRTTGVLVFGTFDAVVGVVVCVSDEAAGRNINMPVNLHVNHV